MDDEPVIDFDFTGKRIGLYVQMFVDDILGGTGAYNSNLFGAYHFLLYHQWQNGFIPRDLNACQMIGRCDSSTIEQILAPAPPEKPKFVLHSCGGLINVRMARDRHERAEFLRDQKRKSELGLSTRGLTRGSTRGSTPQIAPPSPSPSPSPKASPKASPTPTFPTTACGAACQKIAEACPEEHRPTFEQIVLWCRPFGLKPEEHADAIAANAKAKPAHKWTQHGAENVRYAIEDVAKNHERPQSRSRGQPLWAKAKALQAKLDSLVKSTNHPTDEQRKEIQDIRKKLKEINDAIAEG